MTPVRLPRLTCGIETVDSWIDNVCGAIERALTIHVSGNVTLTQTRSGLHLHVPEFPIAIVVTASTITARSGATPGNGTANFQMFNGISFVANSARQGIKVYNYSASATLTPSGKYGVALKVWGVWWLVVVEC